MGPFTLVREYISSNCLNLFKYNEENPEISTVRKSPPEPLTHNMSSCSLVRGSIPSNLEDVFPPPVLVIVKSLPKQLDL